MRQARGSPNPYTGSGRRALKSVHPSRTSSEGQEPEPEGGRSGACTSVRQRAMTVGSYKATASRGHLLPRLHAATRTGRGAHSAESAPAGGNHSREAVRKRSGHPPRVTQSRQVESRGSTWRSHPFTSERFHVLLNSLFKVLFNFPSRYLSTIGLVPVFSLRWSLPPTLGCILKQPDSPKTVAALGASAPHGAITLSDVPFQVNFDGERLGCKPPLPATIRWHAAPEIACSSSSRFARRYWGNPG